MKRIKFRYKKDGITCATKCPHTGLMVGSWGCQGCGHYFFKFNKEQEVLCNYE